MYCTRKVQEDLIWVGADDRRLVCFEGVFACPRGMSYNSYLLLDEKNYQKAKAFYILVRISC